jgi:hypothetical protein
MQLKENEIEMLKKTTQLLGDIRLNFNSERASFMGQDIINGIIEGNVGDRLEVWENWYKNAKSNTSVTEEERNGIWVPAIPL